jgi:hypothetical protein
MMANNKRDPANLVVWLLCVSAFLIGTVVGYQPGKEAGRSEAAREIADYVNDDLHLEEVAPLIRKKWLDDGD